MESKMLKNEFTCEKSTWFFVFLTCVTGVFYAFYWNLKTLELFSKEHDIETSKVSTAIKILFVNTSIYFFIHPILSWLTLDSLAYSQYQDVLTLNGIKGFLSLVYLILSIIYGLEIKKILEELMYKKGIDKKPSMLWAAIFNLYYMYYFLRHAEDTMPTKPQSNPESTISQLDKLVELKEKGLLTDEEFVSEKKKLLA